VGKPRIGVSACLLGEKVRYDGRHKYDPLVTETLAESFDLVPVCPEVELGLGVPREPMQLEGDSDHPHLVVTSTRVDLTDRMQFWCRERLHLLEKESLHGFVFKSKSPSCGMGSGLFARAIEDYFPGLPVVDEVRLQDPDLRADFIARVSAPGLS